MVQNGKNVTNIEKYFPFDEGIGNYELNCKGYNFLHIKSNGGINPYANRPTDHKTIEELLTIYFDDGDRLLINKEYDRYDIRNKTQGVLNYRTPAGMYGQYQGGHGDLVIILAKYAEQKAIMEKHDPYFSTGLLNVGGGGGHAEGWLGENQKVSMTNYLPYIPVGYSKLCLFIATTCSNFTVDVIGYSGIQSATATNIIQVTTVGEHIIDNACNRISLLITNNDIPGSNFEVHGFFV
jgi:hypothetical protein